MKSNVEIGADFRAWAARRPAWIPEATHADLRRIVAGALSMSWENARAYTALAALERGGNAKDAARIVSDAAKAYEDLRTPGYQS